MEALKGNERLPQQAGESENVSGMMAAGRGLFKLSFTQPLDSDILKANSHAASIHALAN